MNKVNNVGLNLINRTIESNQKEGLKILENRSLKCWVKQKKYIYKRKILLDRI